LLQGPDPRLQILSGAKWMDFAVPKCRYAAMYPSFAAKERDALEINFLESPAG
jgi:hypothetical protein